jgi:hypothetical protein
MGGSVDRVVATYRIGGHNVVLVESCEEDGSWFHLVVDGLARDELLDAPPTAEDLARVVPVRASR